MTREQLISILDGYDLAISTIRAWHGIGHDPKEEILLWAIYQKSPEMQAINTKKAMIEAMLRGMKGDI